MKHQRIVVGVDVGTSKICAAVGEAHADGSVIILGIGQSLSQGVRKGEVVDVDAAREAIHAAVTDAENSAGVVIREVYASVTGGHIRSFNNHGITPVAGDDRVITNEDVENVLRNARAISLPIENGVVHTIKQSFTVDGQKGVENPVGMLGTRLEADVHVIHGVRTRLQNTIKAVKSVPIDVKGIVFSPLAATLAILAPQQKELGAVLVDMGGGVTEFTAHIGGTIRHSGVFAVGGDHVSNDIAIGLKLPINRAEHLKIEHGMLPASAVPHGQNVTLKHEVGLPDREISREVICRIMELRLEETFQLIRSDLEQERVIDGLGAGMFLTGGCASIPGIKELAEKVMGMPVHIGTAGGVCGVQTALDSPECVTAIGLVKFAALTEAQQPVRKMGFAEKLLRIVRIW